MLLYDLYDFFFPKGNLYIIYQQSLVFNFVGQGEGGQQ